MDENVKQFLDKALDPATHSDPVPSARRVVSERAIFDEPCPHCGVKPMKPCRNADKSLLMPELHTTEMPFHPQRIIEAIRTRLTETMAGNLSAAERMLICYYAFIMQCDAMAANSEKLFSKKFTSQELQACFCQSAITELIRDRMIRDPRAITPKSSIIKPN